MVEVAQLPASALPDYAGLSIAFEVRGVLDVVEEGGVIALRRREAAFPPYLKDYDALDGGPLRWPRRFDLSKWTLFGAHLRGVLVGGAAVAPCTTEVWSHQVDQAAAVLWDLRVSAAARRRGVGSALLDSVERWAKAARVRELRVETQTNNVPACRFYERHGFVMEFAMPRPSPAVSEEIHLLWRKSLGQVAAGPDPGLPSSPAAEPPAVP